MDRWLRRAADFVTILVGVIILVVVADRVLGVFPNRQPEAIGTQIDLEPRVRGERGTLLMVLDSECTFCQESVPFYRQLLERDGKAVRIVLVALQSDAGMDAFLDRHELQPRTIMRVTTQSLPVRGTPTLLLVDEHEVGHARMDWSTQREHGTGSA